VSKRSNEASRRPIGPGLEALEARDLLSSGPLSSKLSPGISPGRSVAERAGMGDSSSGGGSSMMTGQPTPHEQVRENFKAVFYGPFIVGPGRFSMQAMQTFITGGGTANQFRHGNVQVALFIPSNPSQGVTGTAKLYDKSFLMTSNILSLSLQGNPQPLLDGRPTMLTWTVGSSSSGAFGDATGQGTVEIRYFPGGHLPPRATSAGNASVIFSGQLNTLGTNPVRLKLA